MTKVHPITRGASGSSEPEAGIDDTRKVCAAAGPAPTTSQPAAPTTHNKAAPARTTAILTRGAIAVIA